MKRTAVVFAFAILSVVMLLSSSLKVEPAFAQDAGYGISFVAHQVEIMYSGHLAVEDTINFTGNAQGSFLIGFPYKYGPYVIKALAFDSTEILNVTLGVQLPGPNAFYGASVALPVGVQTISVIFLLSNQLVTQTKTGFSIDFPAYPTLVTDVAMCNVSLVIPPTAENITLTKSDGTTSATSYSAVDLAAFTSSPGNATFDVPPGYIQITDLQTLDRQITVDAAGAVTCSDSYRLANNGLGNITSITFNMPAGASNIIGKDQLGRNLTVAVFSDSDGNPLANATLILPLKQFETYVLTLEYTLPRTVPKQTTLFTLNLDLFSNIFYYVDQASISVNPPEGARFTSPVLSPTGSSFTLDRNIFQQTLTIERAGASFVDGITPMANKFSTTFDFNPLWIPFWPTLWMWTLAAIGFVVAFILRRPKAQAEPKIVVPKLSGGISPDKLGTFADEYEERNRIASELKSLDNRAQKGRITRRRYKVQRRTLEIRLSTLSQSIKDLEELLRSAGGNYADLVRQLEAAEKETEELETNMNAAEVRQKRGELSLEESKKLQNDYQRRKEKADMKVNGILLRLREEIH